MGCELGGVEGGLLYVRNICKTWHRASRAHHEPGTGLSNGSQSTVQAPGRVFNTPSEGCWDERIFREMPNFASLLHSCLLSHSRTSKSHKTLDGSEGADKTDHRLYVSQALLPKSLNFVLFWFWVFFNLLRIFPLLFHYFLCMDVLSECISAPHACLEPWEVRRGHQILWTWSYRLLWAPTWLLRIKPRSSASF